MCVCACVRACVRACYFFKGLVTIVTGNSHFTLNAFFVAIDDHENGQKKKGIAIIMIMIQPHSNGTKFVFKSINQNRYKTC